MTIEQAIQINCEASCSDKEAEAHDVLVTKLREQKAELDALRIKILAGDEVGLGPYTLVPNEHYTGMVETLQAADELYALVGDNYPRNSPIWGKLNAYRAAREGK